uniref:uncharacterized protein LOC122586951 n=1 Tax=Erigeron canadensis TaxID=72917 RepID=UPI001CB8E873|nr:uncharacterized protein LOC122586951 [Erigeron canadensis]
MDLLKFINSDMTWGAVKKGHRSNIGRPRQQVGKSRIKGNKIQDSVVSDYEKSGVAVLGQRFAEAVLDVPIKKRILKLQSPSVSGEVARLPQPQTSSHEDIELGSKQREHLMLNKKEVSDSNDFSGIELLADAACHSSVFDGSSQLEPSEIEKQTTPRADAKTDGSKEEITPMDSDVSSVHDTTLKVVQSLCDNGNGETDKSHAPPKASRLHWDLNTVMEEWEEPCTPVDDHCEKSNMKDTYNDDLLNSKTNLESYETRNSQVAEEKGSTLHDATVSIEPFCKSEILGTQGNNDGVITCKTSDAESSMSKSDVLDSFAYPLKCETVSTSTASVSLGQTTLKVEPLIKSDDGQAESEIVQGGCLSFKGDCDDKLTSEDRLSDCCGSNVSHDERAEENTVDKVKVDYDSPVEDGEFREPTIYHIWQKDEVEDTEDIECVDYESDNMYEDNFDTNESVQDEIEVGHQQTNGTLGAELINEHHESVKAEVLGSKDKASDYQLQERSQCASLEKKDDSLAKLNTVSRSGGNVFCTDRSTSFGARKDNTYRSDNIGYSYSRAERDFGPGKFIGRDRPYYRGRGPNDDGQWGDSFSRNSRGGSNSRDNNRAINYNPRSVNRTFNNRPSPSDRNESYGVIPRGTSPARGISHDRFKGGVRRVPPEYYNDSDPCYSERKVHSFSSNYNRGAHIPQSRKRSRSRSRSGSPIAWHFQKKRSMDTNEENPDHRSDTRVPFRKPSFSGEIEASRGYNERNGVNGPYRDKRSSPVSTLQRNQRFDPPGYLGRVKPEENIRAITRPGRFPQASINNSTIHDDKYGMMNERRQFRDDLDDPLKARYPRNKDNGFRYPRNDYRCFKDSENTIEEKGCRYTANKMFNTGERYFQKNNLQRE